MSPPLRIGLVGCGKDKLDTPVPVPAVQLYTGALVRLSLAESVHRFGATHTFILSAGHGLVPLDRQLEPYDASLRKVCAVRASVRWGAGVAAALAELYPARARAEVHIFAGAPYVAALAPHLPGRWLLVDALEGLTQGYRLRLLSQLRSMTTSPQHPRETRTMQPASTIRVPAIRVHQSEGRTLYLFSVDGKDVPKFATVSRIKRRPGEALRGYQRPEALAHIDAIRSYIESKQPLIPNAVVLAFTSQVRFVPAVESAAVAVPGELVIPVPPEGTPDHEKPAFVVDGQQRLAAVREAEVASFPLAVSAFITDDTSIQTEQFLLVNNVKPIPKGLIYELLPNTSATLPPALERRRLPATLVEKLNTLEGSPLRGIINTATNPDGLLKETGLLKALEGSISDGALWEFHHKDTREPDVDGMVDLVARWWGAVQDTFPKSWGKPPKESRLFHGAGVVALSLLMDAVCYRLRKEHGVEAPTREQLARELAYVKDDCRWMDGTWEFRSGPRKWNELQNTRQDCEALARFLTQKYRDNSHGKAPLKHRAKR